MMPSPKRHENFINEVDLGGAQKTYAALASRNDTPREQVIAFGPFCLFTARRLLEKNGNSVDLRGRAFDILLVLIEHANKVVSKSDLAAKVWANLTVSDGTLRVQISALRKTLGDGQFGARYIANVNGRGYCFVAPLMRSINPSPVANRSLNDASTKLPAASTCMLGRDDAVASIIGELTSRRFLTIVGSGGVGKTTVAVSVGRRVQAAFDDAVYFFDLGSLSDETLVPSRLASALGIPVASDDAIAGVLTFLRDKRTLIILDSCEHVVETIAALAERLFKETPNVHILATSRESLRVDGEHLHRLAPLKVPPAGSSLTAAEALTFPAVQLFVARAAAVESGFKLTDANAPIVGSICHKLDGIPLAIELAAREVEAYSLKETAARLDGQFQRSWNGRRTALPRHQTLSATFDWSHNRLTDIERLVWRRLAVFKGPFSFEAARFVAAGEDKDLDVRVAAVIARLVAKSLVTVDADDSANRYRLLNTTRAYVLRELVEAGEEDEIRGRHASLKDLAPAVPRDSSDQHGPRWPRRKTAARAEGIIQLRTITCSRS